MKEQTPMNTIFTRRNAATTLAAVLAVVFGGGLIAPNIAAAQTSKDKKRQNDKNLMRNIGVGAGAAAAYEALHGRGTNALILGAGAAYAGKKYEDARKAQNKDNSSRRVYRYRNGKRVGYYNYRNGHRYGSYHRLNG